MIRKVTKWGNTFRSSVHSTCSKASQPDSVIMLEMCLPPQSINTNSQVLTSCYFLKLFIKHTAGQIILFLQTGKSMFVDWVLLILKVQILILKYISKWKHGTEALTLTLWYQHIIRILPGSSYWYSIMHNVLGTINLDWSKMFKNDYCDITQVPQILSF